MEPKFDFSGWATKNDLKCSDGRTIRRNAFKANDGQTVPLVWQHQHNSPENVLGHALLENRDEGVYAYCKFNDTETAKTAKELVQHGDVTMLSIYANQLQQNGGDVLHGVIREVSLVLAGANKGAFIDFPVLAHGDEYITNEEEAVIYTGEEFELFHADAEQEKKEEKKEEPPVADEKKEQTVKDVFDEFTDEQKNVVYFMIGQALEDAGVKSDEAGDEVEHSDNEKGEDEMKHNVFENDTRRTTLSHDDMKLILADAKRLGSLKDAVLQHMESGVLAHADMGNGLEGPEAADATEYGMYPVDYLFPDYKSLNTPPEFIKRDTSWVTRVMNGAHHTPFSRIKSVFANITEDEARALGYIKGHQKKNEVFSLLKRTTDPQTVYKKQKMDRDDIVDITDFDVVAWLKSEMRGMLDEELARAILIGDGRLSSDDDKISEDHIRSIVNDNDLFTIKVGVNMSGTDPYKNLINSVIRSRKNYKGSGSPVFFTTEDVLTEMLLLEDGISHPLYADEAALARKLRVSSIVTVPVMEGAKTSTNKNLLGVIVNMNDYNIGADKGGAVNMFDDFDINYNQYLYLIETRISGALTKPYSAIAIYDSGAAAQDEDEGNQ